MTTDKSPEGPQDEALIADVQAAVCLLEGREWTEHFARTPMGQRLESAITALHARVQELEQAVAAEREACAQVCDTQYHNHIGPAFGEVRYGIAACAAAIRARGAQGERNG